MLVVTLLIAAATAAPDAGSRAVGKWKVEATLVLKPKGEVPMPALSFDLAQLGEALSEWREACPIKDK